MQGLLEDTGAEAPALVGKTGSSQAMPLKRWFSLVMKQSIPAAQPWSWSCGRPPLTLLAGLRTERSTGRRASDPSTQGYDSTTLILRKIVKMCKMHHWHTAGVLGDVGPMVLSSMGANRPSSVGSEEVGVSWGAAPGPAVTAHRWGQFPGALSLGTRPEVERPRLVPEIPSHGARGPA